MKNREDGSGTLSNYQELQPGQTEGMELGGQTGRRAMLLRIVVLAGFGTAAQ